VVFPASVYRWGEEDTTIILTRDLLARADASKKQERESKRGKRKRESIDGVHSWIWTATHINND
jgi:hypothetical protein